MPQRTSLVSIGAATLTLAVASATVLANPSVVEAYGLETGGSGTSYYLNDQFTPKANHEFELGRADDRAYFGDWNGDGVDTAMLRRGAQYLTTSNNDSPSTGQAVTIGSAGDEVFVGDWDGDGRDTLAVRRGSQFYVRNSLSAGPAEFVVAYGRAGDTILVGDWNGDGKDSLAVRRGSIYHVRNTMTSGRADRVIGYGRASDAVLVGDWNGNGRDTFAVRRSSTYFISNTIREGAADITVIYGRPGDTSFVGDWNGDGVETLGVRRATAAATPAPDPVPAPGTGGMPGPNNTGVPAGVNLRVHNGNMVITRAGTVIDGLDIRGFVDVRAANVTIRNSIIRGGAEGGQDSLVRSASNSASLTITDSELVASVASPKIDGLRGWNITAERLDIHHVLDGVHLWGSGNVTMRNSWVHDILHFENDPGWNGGPSHDDTVQIQSGSNITLTGNRIEGAYNAGIILTQDAGPISNVRITDNFLDGGACTINISEKSHGPLRGIVIDNNTFGENSQHNCHVIYPPSSSISLDGNRTANGGALKYVKR
ncbi:right-handed parallel beta-helix repeat-containing protein [Agrococcus sp. ProA11]|uniref:right-handed parallel beta-helix repeat-containing protein n=1 Tax=Agrococcus chionoecetis TaxID=3153752 RepID=UPI0032606E63